MTKPLSLANVRWWPLLLVVAMPGAALADDAPGAAPPAEAGQLEQQARTAAQAGYCETATNAVARLAALDPARHAALQQEPAIEACAARAREGVKVAPLRGLAIGTRVRVAFRGDGSPLTGLVAGAYAGVEGGTIQIDEGVGSRPTAIQLAELRGIERSRGRQSHALSGLRWGLVAGAAAGVIATLAIGRGGDEEQYMPEYTLLPPAAIGALVGLVIGATRSTERWEPIARW
jgi:hypothetical protein